MNSITEQISCPICLEIPENEIFQCRNGHNICGVCCTSVVLCPQCRVPYGEDKVRNRTVEAIVQSLKVDCSNKANGCPERLLPDSLDTHKDACEYKTNNVKLCQHMGFYCEHKVNAHNIASILQHLQTEHEATTQTVSKFCMKLDAFPSHDTAGVDKTWPPHVIKLTGSNIVITAHLKNGMLSCLGVILEKSTEQKNQYTVEFQITALANEAVHVVWQHPMLSLSAIVKRATVQSGPVHMDYIRDNAMSTDGSVSINVCIMLPNAATKHLIDAAATSIGQPAPATGVIAATTNDDVVDPFCSIQEKPGQKDVTLLETKVLALCLSPYDAWNAEEITLKRGDVVRVISEDIYYGWWKCEFNGKIGLVPESKLTVVSNGESSKSGEFNGKMGLVPESKLTLVSNGESSKSGEFNGKMGLVPESKLTVVSNGESSKSDTISANRRTNNIRWVKCKGGQHGNVQNSVMRGRDLPVRAAIPGLNFKVAGCLHKGDTTAVICFKYVVYHVPEYEILCIPEGYWKWSEPKIWGNDIPDGSISTGINPDGTETYVGCLNGFGCINAEGLFHSVAPADAVERSTDYYFILAAKP